MGEYVIRNSDGIKIQVGVCEGLSQIRYDDRFKVTHAEGNRECSAVFDCFWRLPFPDEDDIPIGEYIARSNQWDSFRRHPLQRFQFDDKLGETFSLHSIKNDSKAGLKAVVISNESEQMWSISFEDVLPYIVDDELKARIEKYAEE